MSKYLSRCFLQLLGYAFVGVQMCLPHHFVSKCVGRLAESRMVWLKNAMIKGFVKTFSIDVQVAESSNLDDYASFNAFFIRKLRVGERQIEPNPDVLVSPCDGRLLSYGQVSSDGFFIKRHHYSLKTLLGGQATDLANSPDVMGAVIYLAPSDYHRVHMPFDGQLKSMLYVPGRLYSVNAVTSDVLPDLFARNERLVCTFDTQLGQMVVVLVGAMIVGSMAVSWEGVVTPVDHYPHLFNYQQREIALRKGDELGYFKMGSTVAIFAAGAQPFNQGSEIGSSITMGQGLFSAVSHANSQET